jgi:hypothetical protein
MAGSLASTRSLQRFGLHFLENFDQHCAQQILTVRQPSYGLPHPLPKILPLQLLLTRRLPGWIPRVCQTHAFA